MDRAHNAPVLAVHVDDRPPPAVSIEILLSLYGSGGWDRKYFRGPWSVQRRLTVPVAGNVRLLEVFRPNFREMPPFRIQEARISSDKIDQDPTRGTLRSSVVHSPGGASSNPLAWLASLGPGGASATPPVGIVQSMDARGWYCGATWVAGC